jgi:hypothetical protein
MVEYYEDNAGGWRFRVKSGNHEIVASGESYANKSNAKRGYRALLDAVHADLLAELRAGTIVESEESMEAGKSYIAMLEEGAAVPAAEGAADAAMPAPVAQALATVAIAGAAVDTDKRRGRR